MSLRLGFHYHIPAYQDEQGIYRTAGEQGVFLDSLASQCDALICFLYSPIAHENPYMSYALRSPNITLVNLGPHQSIPQRFSRMRQVTAQLSSCLGQLDVLLLRGPSPLLPTFAQKSKGLPVALLIVGDYKAGVHSVVHTGWRRALIRLFVIWNAHQQLRVARKALTFVNSQKLYSDMQQAQVPNLKLIQTTTLTKADFYEREDTCATTPIRLLYTGRIVRAKGLFEMVDAVAWLVQRGQDIVLNLLGQTGQDATLSQLERFAHAKGVGDRVHYRGYKTVGPDLFTYYKDADIYLIASLNNFEGFPRTIWEALAHSLPVVATRVGSIPTFLKDQRTALLVEPQDSVALGQAILRIITEPSLRHSLIKNGYDLVRHNTLERRSSEMISSIREWLGPRP
ncbi:MAG: glycosyltransferase family 4 protein [Anaerolineales bacterium]|nr:glycosyltransferase family 4 protein [Anaerolineales bacterium]